MILKEVNPFFRGKTVKELDTTREGLYKVNDYVIATQDIKYPGANGKTIPEGTEGRLLEIEHRSA